jgi:protein TonB
VTAHLLVLIAAVVGPRLQPRKPLIQVADGFSVPLPPGGGGLPQPPETAAPGPPQPAPVPQPQPKVEPPPKVIKPPKEEKRKGLPELDAKKVKKRPEKTQTSPVGSVGQRSPGTSASGGAIGIGIGPPGPGVPGGTDMFGDWYLAGVQQKIWIIWTQQVKAGFTTEIKVSFVILADGSVADVSVTQPSGVTLLDLAAQRAVMSAGPFGPLPKSYGTNRYPIQALFKPTP